MRKQITIFAILLISITFLAQSIFAKEVDDARLLGAEKDSKNWLTYSRGFNNNRYSTLNQITKSNVKKLVPKWIYQTGLDGSFQVSPLVVDGTMYFSTPYNHVVALDAATGKQLWRYKHKLRTKKLCCGTTNRGISINYGKIYMITIDARLIALDRKDGSVLWDSIVADPTAGRQETLDDLLKSDDFRNHKVNGWTGFAGNMAPMVFGNKVIVGVSGTGYGLHVAGKTADDIGGVVGLSGKKVGLRAFVSAYEASTGKLLWRWYSTKEKGWEGKFVTQTGAGDKLDRDIEAEKKDLNKYKDSWQRGGGSVWTHPAFDPELGLLYVGTGNAAPQGDSGTRPGDNLYTSSLVALDINTGKLKWYYQQSPHDEWGYDVASPPVLFELEQDGKTIPAIAQASKMGFLFVHDRRTGELIKRSDPFVPMKNLFKKPTREGVVIYPAEVGGVSWSPVSYNPKTKRIYVAAIHMPIFFQVHDIPKEKQMLGKTYTSFKVVKGHKPHGVLSSINPKTGKIDWQVITNEMLIGGLVTKTNGLLFMGESNGHMTARDTDNGQLLWQFQTGAGVNAPPIVYEVGGKEFVAVASGGNKLFRTPAGNAIIAFGLAE